MQSSFIAFNFIGARVIKLLIKANLLSLEKMHLGKMIAIKITAILETRESSI